MFVVEFGSKVEMDRVLAGAPWMVGRHAVILKPYDERLSTSEIIFLSCGALDQDSKPTPRLDESTPGIRAMNLIGNVIKMDVDGDGKANGAFLHA